MQLRYQVKDDSKDREGDLAREGFIHLLSLTGSSTELHQVQAWCQENLKEDWKVTSGTYGFSPTRPMTEFKDFLLKSLDEAILFRFRWS